jgi:hypothetical protein
MKISLKKIFILSGCCALLIVGYLAGVYAQKRKLPAAGFLQSTATSIQIGIWDKQDVAKSNDAVFTVTAPDGKQYKANKSEPLDNWVYANFPNDFEPYVDTSAFAAYKWTATVDGKTVAGGNFKYGNGQADDNNRNLK